MATLKNCRSCGRVVAKNAIACPECGRVNPSPGILRQAVNALVLIIIVFVVLAALVGASASAPI